MPKGEHNDSAKGRHAARIRWARVRGKEVPESKKGCPEARVVSKYGKASEYYCDCGNDALDWAWIHGTDRESTESYVPKCRSCHAVYDGVAANLIPRTGIPWTESRRAKYEATIAARREGKRNAEIA